MKRVGARRFSLFALRTSLATLIRTSIVIVPVWIRAAVYRLFVNHLRALRKKEFVLLSHDDESTHFISIFERIVNLHLLYISTNFKKLCWAHDHRKFLKFTPKTYIHHAFYHSYTHRIGKLIFLFPFLNTRYILILYTQYTLFLFFFYCW